MISERTFNDQMGRQLTVPFPPRRIISLVPSQTELLADIGLEEEVAGITKFCIHPERWYSSKPRIGGTKQFDFDKIDNLKPDLIIGNKEENYQEGIERLAAKYPVWMSDVSTLYDAMMMTTLLGKITGRESESEQLVSKIREGFNSLEQVRPKRVLYLIWRKPWMAAGTNTFINDMLTRVGLVNAVVEERYPQYTIDALMAVNPDVIFLSSEPFPFSQKHLAEVRDKFPRAIIMLVDGEMFSWYGSRLIHAPAYFRELQRQLHTT